MKNTKRPVALFAISSLGLGHATRTLPVVRSYLPTHDVHIVSAGNALSHLKAELGSAVTFYEYRDYPPIERGTGWKFYWHLVTDSIDVMITMKREHFFFRSLARRIGAEFVFSDGRYGAYSREIPSFILAHQVRFSMPPGFDFFQPIADYFNYLGFRNFDLLLIPDFEDMRHSLAGELARHPMIEKLNHRYVGILSSLERTEAEGKADGASADGRDIDLLFSISGYLKEHRASFVGSLLDAARSLPGKKVFILGDASDTSYKAFESKSVTIHASVSGEERQRLFERAKCVVSRSGYTTIMDLVELDTQGVLIPTPGQTEQEYLADFLEKSGRFGFLPHDEPNLTEALAGAVASAAERATLVPAPWLTAQSVSIIRSEISRRAEPAFFSIVIPAHNEEEYLGATLDALNLLEYPGESFEVIVVENGSADKTLDLARSYERIGSPIRTMVSEPGVSKAKNAGLAAASPLSQWTVFLDADTHLSPCFLRDLNACLKRRRKDGLSVGTTTVLPQGRKRLVADFWFALYNIGHALTRTSFSIQLMKTSFRSEIGFDENKTFTEDLSLIKDLQKKGRFFYFRTRDVSTSTRRFDEVGWLRLFLLWNWQAHVLAKRQKEAKGYGVVR